MSTATSITVADGKGTPVNHTLTPEQNPDGSGFTFIDSLLGIPTYEWKLWAKLKKGNTREPSVTSMGVIMPVTVTVNSIVSQDHVNSSKCEFTFAPNATAAERADIYALTINGLNQALIKEQTRDLKSLY